MGARQSLRTPRRSSFVVRIDRDDKGNATGVIERVRTGEKEPLRGLDAISGLIARMVEAESGVPTDPPRSAGSRPNSSAPGRHRV
jgi:hypothetical protein